MVRQLLSLSDCAFNALARVLLQLAGWMEDRQEALGLDPHTSTKYYRPCLPAWMRELCADHDVADLVIRGLLEYDNYYAHLSWQPGNPGDDGEPINWFLATTGWTPHDKVAAWLNRGLNDEWIACIPTFYDPETDKDAICLGSFKTVEAAKTAAQLYAPHPGLWI